MPSLVDNAYRERNTLVAMLARQALADGRKAGWWLDPEQEEGWRHVVCVELPTGQATWRFSDADFADLCAGLPQIPNEWDGHTSSVKWGRVLRAYPQRPNHWHEVYAAGFDSQEA